MVELRHADRVALVTGGAEGMGRSSAKLFAEEGATVVLCDINVQGGERTAAEIRSDGGNAQFVPADVTDEDQVRSLIDGIVERFGQLDIAHNNAGGLIAPPMPTADLPREVWDATIALNLTSAYLLIKYEVLAMLPRRQGAIVTTSSGDGVRAAPTRQAYSAAKHAVMGLSKAAAGEYGQFGIRINVVAPGPIRTKLMETWLSDPEHTEERQRSVQRALGRLGEADEIAHAVSWLCSDEASFVNGTELFVDGGRIH